MPSDLKGPWKVDPVYPSGCCAISRWAERRITLDSVDAAEAKCAELNAAERVRDAASELLAACEAVIESNALHDWSELEAQLNAAIAQAKTT